MTEVFPVFVVSKSRPEFFAKGTGRALGAVPFTAVVEPQDAVVYAKHGPVLELPENDRGLPYARQFVLQHVRQQSLEWFWMLDDDIDTFFTVKNRRCVKIDGRAALTGAQQLFLQVPALGQAALEYKQFAWSSTKAVRLNGYCDVAVCINVANTRFVNYRDVTLKEDRDFTLQILSTGRRTARITRFAFGTARNGSNHGGLYPLYATDGFEEAQSRRMEQLWSGICSFHRKPDGRPDVRINWAAYR